MSNNYDASKAASAEDGIFGLPHSYEQAKFVILPVPWDVTTSYGQGTHKGPNAVLQASPQLDLYDIELGNAYECGIHMLPADEDTLKTCKKLRPKAELIMQDPALNKITRESLNEINQTCQALMIKNQKSISNLLSADKVAILLGGDHSTSESAIKAYSEHFEGNFSLLHIDAHMDLRNAYQGFKNSHASVMHNIMHSEVRPKNLVQVGIRDFCQEEFEISNSHSDIKTYFDESVAEKLLSGTSWAEFCEEVVADLGDQVYISCDIDGLSPDLSPNTGTPVVGGLNFYQYLHLIKTVVRAGKKIIGFDLVEVCPGPQDEWDGNVGARVLYKMISWTAKSQGLLK